MSKRILPLDVKFYQTNEFRQLEQEWYGKLVDQGFSDAEESQSANRAFLNARRKGMSWEHEEEYFRLLNQVLYDAEFESELDQIILNRVAEGKKITEISNEIKGLGLEGWHRQTIRFRIRKYENKLGLRRWPDQMLNPSWKNGRRKPPTP